MNGNEQEVGLERQQYHWSTPGPFSQAGNIFLFFAGGDRGRTLDAIIASIGDGMPLIHVHGEPGSGKTLLAMVLADRLAERYNIIRVEHESLGAGALLQQLGIELCPSMTTPVGSVRRGGEMTPAALAVARVAVSSALVSGTPGNRPVLLLIDSPDPVDALVRNLLDELSTLCNEHGQRLLQTVLFERADPEPVRGMAQYDGASRASLHHWLRRLTLAETGDYLHHQMTLFDYNRREVFTREMAYFIADRSDGVFRAINTIARNAFVIAGLENEPAPRMSHLLLAGLPTRDARPQRPPFVRRHRQGVFALLAAVVVASMVAAIVLSAR